MITVAALYVDKLGCYPKMYGVDCWDETRDARLYDGPHPVVAHPPCGKWGRLRQFCKRNDADCGPRAVGQVQNWGGVLEHPAGSKLWEHCGLPRPIPWDFGLKHKRIRAISCFDGFGGYTIEVDQVEWGHVARKRTWLYLVGVPREALEAPPFPGREPTHWIHGGRGRTETRNHTPVPPGIKIASAQQRRRTPPLFAGYLVRLARSVRI